MWGLAPKTRESYDTPTRSYLDYCLTHSSDPPLPASREQLIEWITHLGVNRLLAKTIGSYLVGLQSYHIDLGYAGEDLNALTHPMLKRITAGIRRRNGEAEKQERRPITRDVLSKLLGKLNPKSRDGANVHAAFCLAFAGFLRISKFTYSAMEQRDPEFNQWHVTRSSISFNGDTSLELRLPASKTDPWRRGVTIPIAATFDAACPVAALKSLFTRFPSEPKEPLFQSTAQFSRQYVTILLRNLLHKLGIRGHYSGHSFGRGAASWAELRGLTPDEIQVLGRWKSDSYRLYIERDISRVLSYSQRFQTTS